MNTKFSLRENEKGFSLVELIIVIAIMAVLVGVVGTQVIPYMENSKRAKDIQILTAYATAGVMAYATYADAAPITATMTITVTSNGTDDIYSCDVDTAQKIVDELETLIASNYITNANKTFQSRTFKPTKKIQVIYDFDNRTIVVYALDDSNVVINANENVFGSL